MFWRRYGKRNDSLQLRLYVSLSLSRSLYLSLLYKPEGRSWCGHFPHEKLVLKTVQWIIIIIIVIIINIIIFVLLLVLLLLLSMMILIGFTCPLTIHFMFLTKCDKCHYKERQLLFLQSVMVCYYKVRQLLITSATGITKCDSFIIKCDRTRSHQRKLMLIYSHQFAPTDWFLSKWTFFILLFLDMPTYPKISRI